MKTTVTLLAAALLTSGIAGAAEPWRYETNTSKMGEQSKTATTFSSQAVDLSYPWDGSTWGRLQIVKAKSGTSVHIATTSGLLMCHSYRPCKVRVRFDDASPRTFLGYPPDSGDSTIAFLENASAFIAEARKATKILVEVNFFQEGRRIFEFEAGKLVGF